MSRFHRDLLANAHLFASKLVALDASTKKATSKTCSIYDGNGVVIGWNNLFCIARQASQKEIDRYTSIYAVDYSKVFEIPRQGSFPFNGTGAGTYAMQDIRPDRFKILYGLIIYEINEMMTDDSEIFDLGTEEAPAVITLMCTRMASGKGELPL